MKRYAVVFENKDLEALLNKLGVKLTLTYLGLKNPKWQNQNWLHDTYSLSIRLNGKSESFKFFNSKNSTDTHEKPSVCSILDCIFSDAKCTLSVDTFDEFCSDLGYDNDSRHAEGIYKACKKTFSKLQNIFGADLDNFLEFEFD